ncbi:hypothetical protein ACFL5U_00155 [Candidatus Margulisiibacteriota bacterium]
MLKRLFLLWLIMAALIVPAFGRNGPAPKRSFTFVEFWNNLTYYDTNIEKKGFASLLGRLEGKLGLNLFNSPLQLYGVYYSAISQNDSYWNNPLYSGVGVRYVPLESYAAQGWMDEWLRGLKIYVETLNASYYKNSASAEAAGLNNQDTRYGLEVWHEWNLDKPDRDVPWAELWAKLGFRSTNFTATDFNSYILYLQPKVGRHIGKGVGAYLRLDLTYSGKDDYWLNVADYGVGVRFDPWREGSGVNDLLRKFNMYVEFLAVTYLKDRPTDSNKEVSSDVRFGIDFSYGR